MNPSRLKYRTPIVACLVTCFTACFVGGCKQDKPDPTVSGTASLGTSAVNGSDSSDAPETVPLFQFQDVTESAGVEHTITSGYESELFGMIEFVGGGVSVFDFDLDGLVDIMFAGGGYFPDPSSMAGRRGKLFRGSGPFEFSDVTNNSAVNLESWYNHAITCDDINADGFDDMVVTGFGSLQLLINNGDGTFSDATSSLELNDILWSTTAATGDLNNDGLLDIYVAHYGNWSLENNPVCTLSLPGSPRGACSPTQFPGIDDKLFIQNLEGKFVESSSAYALVPGGRGLGVVCCDIDQDGDCDIYIANDEDRNFLYLNEGGGKLTESAIQWGCATDGNGGNQGSMGVAVGDFQSDQRPDLFVTNFAKELPALYSSRGRMGYRFGTIHAGIGLLGPSQVSWGTAFADLDLDGDEEILVVSGHVDRKNPDHLQRPSLLENQLEGFIDRSPDMDGYFAGHWAARGLALFDGDGDGRLDLVVSHLDEPSHILQNVTETDGRYLQVRLIGTRSNRNAVGATVVLHDGDNKQLRLAVGGGSYLSTSQRLLNFTSAKSTTTNPVTLEVRWPSGKRDTITVDGWNKQIYIVEGFAEGESATTFEM